MKIAIITSGILPVPAVQGGAVENLIDFLLEYNNLHKLHQITVYSVYNKRVLSHPALESDVNTYEYINTNTLFYKYYSKIRVYLGYGFYYHHRIDYFLECVWKKMCHQKYDLIILENRPFFAIPLSERTNIPIISHIHTNLLYEDNPIVKRTISATKGFLVVSQYLKKSILNVERNANINVIYNGIDTQSFNPNITSSFTRESIGLNSTDFVIAFWGRLVPKKGIKELLQAITLLKEYEEIKLIVVGSINYNDSDQKTNSFTEELTAIANTVLGKIIFTGFIPYNQIQKFISLANIAVIPSRINEALGMTCLEACAIGLPIIATNDGGIPETLVGQKHILIDKNGDIPAQIAEAILKIKNNYSSYLGNSLPLQFTKDEFSKKFFECINIYNQ